MERNPLSLLSSEYLYIGLIFGLLIFPKMLERFKIPSEVSCLIVGYIAARYFGELSRTHLKQSLPL